MIISNKDSLSLETNFTKIQDDKNCQEWSVCWQDPYV